MTVLFIDACLREKSRTRRLAKALLREFGESADVETLRLYAEKLPVTDETLLQKRLIDAQKQDFSDAVYRYARQFALADYILIAAPFWDLSFPTVLKQYLEAISVTGITFRYSPQGIPQGLCRAKKVFYVTTAGGPIGDSSFGFGYVQALTANLFGIPSSVLIKAENLDIQGNDAEAILQEAIEAMCRQMKQEKLS